MTTEPTVLLEVRDLQVHRGGATVLDVPALAIHFGQVLRVQRRSISVFRIGSKIIWRREL